MKIVLTGGPCAGKTTISEIIVKKYAARLTLVPEAASLLFNGGFPRRSDAPGSRCQQRAIYHVQKELEQITALDNPGTALICDRGSLDGIAYWPNGTDEFLQAIGSTMSKEVERYDWVLHLDTTGIKEYRRSPARVEDFRHASEINERVKNAWSAHPRRIVIPHNDDFSVKIQTVLAHIEKILGT